jgi:hypothetical protein
MKLKHILQFVPQVVLLYINSCICFTYYNGISDILIQLKVSNPNIITFGAGSLNSLSVKEKLSIAKELIKNEQTFLFKTSSSDCTDVG